MSAMLDSPGRRTAGECIYHPETGMRLHRLRSCLQGISYPETGMEHPGGSFMLVVADWAESRGVYATRDGRIVKRFDDLDQLLDRLVRIGGTWEVVLEPAFESFRPDRRDAFILRCRDLGYDLRVISDRQTKRARLSLGLDKSDENDTLALWHLVAVLGKHTSPARRACEIPDDWRDRTAAVNRRAVVMRFTRTRHEALSEVERILGPARGLPDDLRLVLADVRGRSYLAYVSAIFLAACEARTRDEFDRLLGLYQNGYPCILRSEIWSTLTLWGVVRKRGVSMSVFRRTLRKTYHLLRQGICYPETGTEHPGGGAGPLPRTW